MGDQSCNGFALVVFLLVYSIFGITGCTSCSRVATPTIIPVSIKVDVTDPLFRRLVQATDSLKLSASGSLNEGSFKFSNLAFAIEPQTTFKLSASVPIEGKTTIDLATANATVELSKPVKCGPLTSPTKITLSKGQAGLEMDFARTLVGLIANMIQQKDMASSKKSDIDELIKELTVEKAVLKAHPGAVFDEKGGHLPIGPQSEIHLSDLKFSDRKNYSGEVHFDLNLADGASYSIEETRLISKGGQVKIDSKISCQNGSLEVAATGSGTPVASFKLSGFNVHYGEKAKFDLSGKTASIVLESLSLKRKIGETAENLSARGTLTIDGSEFELVSASDQIGGSIPGTLPLALSIESNNETPALKLETSKPIECTKFRFTAGRSGSEFSTSLRSCSLSGLSMTSDIGASANLDSVSIYPESLSFSSGTRKLVLRADQSTVIESKDPAIFTVSKNGLSTPQSLKFGVHSGRLRVSDGAKKVLDVDDLNGNMSIKIADSGVNLNSNLALHVSADKNVLGISGLEGSVKSIGLTADAHNVTVLLDGGRILIDQAETEQLIKNNLPDSESIKVDEQLFKGRQWRYRNFHVSRVKVINPQIKNIRVDKKNHVLVDGESNVIVSGEVEAFHPQLNPFAKDNSKWTSHTWSAKAKSSGSGDIQFGIEPGQSLANSKLKYCCNLRFSFPSSLDVDWSDISRDALGKAESAMIQSGLKGAKFIAGDKKIPFKLEGKTKLFKHPDPALKAIRVSKFVVRPSGKSLEIDFSGALNL